MTPMTVYKIAQLRWIDRKGASQFRQGGAQILAKRLETLRCEATLKLLDGTVVGGCQKTDGGQANYRLKWAWWYDSDAIISHLEPTRTESVKSYVESARAANYDAASKGEQDSMTKTCIRDGCGRRFDATIQETRDASELRSFWMRYCPDHRANPDGPQTPIVNVPPSKKIVIEMSIDDAGNPLTGTLAYVLYRVTESLSKYGYHTNGTHGQRQVGDSSFVTDTRGKIVGEWRIEG